MPSGFIWCALALLQLFSVEARIESKWVTQSTTSRVAAMLTDNSVRGSALVRFTQCDTKEDESDAVLPCVLPINANISLERLGAGETTGVDVTMDVYPGPRCKFNEKSTSYAKTFICDVCRPGDSLPCNAESDSYYHYPLLGALHHDENIATVIRIIFPQGFDASDVEIDNNTMVVYNSLWTETVGNDTFTKTGPYPAAVRRLRYAKAPQPLEYGLSEPRPAHRPLSRVGVLTSFRTGTRWGLRDAEEEAEFDPKRVLDLVTTAPISSQNDLNLFPTWNETQLAQRLKVRLEGLVNRKSTGYIGSASIQDRRIFAIQIYQLSLEDLNNAESGVTESIPPEKFLMRYFNNHINDPCVDGHTPASGVACPISATSLNTSAIVAMGNWYRDTNSNEQALVCPPGTKTLDAKGVVCEACPIGYTSPDAQSAECHPCPPGSFANLDTALIPGGGAAACAGCLAGTFSGETAGSTCQHCFPGTYSGQAFTICSKCEKGSISPSAGAAACTLCPSNASTITDGMTSCQLKCLAGAVGVGGVQPCEACAPGAFAPLPATILCQLCVPGSATEGAQTGEEGGAVGCVECVAGSFADLAGTAVCTECPAQSYQGASAATACFMCPVDAGALAAGIRLPEAAVNLSEAYMSAIYAPVAAASQAAASAPSVSMRTLSAGATSVEQCYRNCLPGQASLAAGLDTPHLPCTPCPAGSSSHLIGSTTCRACALGFHAPSSASLACLECAAGSYADLKGSRICGACAAGTFSAEHAAACTACRNGSFTPVPGTPVFYGCAQCPRGQYSSAQVDILKSQLHGDVI